ncbi:MAG: helix-turn-helix domain-containing protein [Thermoproteota archaeon]|nr:helix-turn-helix domain-containing protein [Thermoproteota archaeon]
MSLTKTSFEMIYRDEEDVNTKERMLLVLNVVYHGILSAHVARDLHRNRTWACVWLKRYEKEGLEGLKNKPRTGRPSELPEEAICNIKTALKESNQGWTTKQVEAMIIEKSGIKYHHTHPYTASFENGDSNKKYQEKCMLTPHPWKRKRLSKKDRTDTCGCSKPLPTAATATATAKRRGRQRLYLSIIG